MKDKKHTKEEAAYVDKAKKKQCAGCAHFRPPSSCEIVEGKISPSGSSKYFKKKTAKD